MLPPRVIVLSGVLALFGCKPPPAPRHDAAASPREETAALGWQVDAPGELIRAGSVRTTPPGREESLMGVVPNAARRAALRCRVDGGATTLPPNVALRFEASVDAPLRPVGGYQGNPFSQCLATELARELRVPPGVVGIVEISLLFQG
jgi:hypothetical protein